MEKIKELLKEWNDNPEIHNSYPDGISQFLQESSESHKDAYDYIAYVIEVLQGKHF